MIYKSSYFKKELKQVYIENKISTRRKLLLGLFQGLVAVAIHFVLRTLEKSVLTDTVPHIMQKSYFTTVYIYTSVAFFFYMLNFILMYDSLSFVEIRKNRWYLLIKMGYSAVNMVLSKILALLYSMVFVYTVGFLVTILMTVFLKYPFVHKYLPALYLVGLIDLIVFSSIVTTASLYFRQESSIRYFTLFTFVAIIALRMATGYTKLISNRALMQNVTSLFQLNRGFYLLTALGIVLTCFIICLFKAKELAKFYNIPYEDYASILPENTELVRRDIKTGKFSPLIKPDMSKLRSKIFDGIMTVTLTLILCFAVVLNIFIILISTSQPGEEVTIRGVIPYIFLSETMEPEIRVNDLAYFKRVGERGYIDVGKIVLFTEDNVVYIERISKMEGDKYVVDIDNYPPMSEKGAMIKTVDRTQIYGVYISANRWLGALILFANTIFGRFVFFLAPVILLFFNKQIKEIARAISQVTADSYN